MQILRNTFTKGDHCTGACTRKEMRFQLEKALIRGYSPISSVQHLNTYSILANTVSKIMIKQEEMPYLRFSDTYQSTLIKFFAFMEKKDLESLKQLITEV